MSDWPIEYWTRALWRYFTPQISSGGPVYFSVDRVILNELVLEIEPKREGDAVEHLARSCWSILEIRGSNAFLKYSVQNEVNGKSNVICLVALQVAAVEEMAEDNVFTGNAYFPRLRALLGFPEFARHPSDPFSQGQFDEIWNKFKTEILSESGASPKTITFHRGRGRDRRRALPISQALLTGQDLAKIYNKNSSDLNNRISNGNVFQVILEARSYLSDRARNLINEARKVQDRQKQLCEQLQNFSEDPKYLLEKFRDVSEKFSGWFSAYRKMDFLARSSIKLYWHDEHGVVTKEETPLKIISYCKDSKYLVFVEESTGFKFCNGSRDISGGESILVVCPNEKMHVIEYVLQTSFQQAILLSQVKCELPSGFSAFFVDLPVSESCVAVVNGVLLAPEVVSERRISLSLGGGVLIDGRRKEYLFPYVPDAVLLGGKEIPHEEMIFLNGEEIKMSQFKELFLDNVSHLLGHNIIEYKDKKITFMLLQSDKSKREYKKYGYVFSGDELSPTLTLLDGDAYCLIGLSLTIPSVEKSDTRRIQKENVAAFSLLFSREHPQVLVSARRLKDRLDTAVKNRSISVKVSEELINNYYDIGEISSVSAFILGLEPTPKEQLTANEPS